MDDQISAAAAAWPDLPAPDASFARALRERAPEGDLGSLHIADLFLAYHAARGHAGAVAHVRNLVRGLKTAMRRTGADEQTIADLLSDLPSELVAPRGDLPPRILGYSGRGPLVAWLRVVAVRSGVEQRHKVSQRPVSVATLGEHAAAAYDPEIALLRKRYTREVEIAFAQAFEALPREQRLLLQQHHVDGLGIDRLAALHGIHRATAARRVAAARDALFDGVRAILTAELCIGDQTFDSIVRLVRSEIDINLDCHAASWHALGAE